MILKNAKLKENICLTTMIFTKFAMLIYLVTMSNCVNLMGKFRVSVGYMTCSWCSFSLSHISSPCQNNTTLVYICLLIKILLTVLYIYCSLYWNFQTIYCPSTISFGSSLVFIVLLILHHHRNIWAPGFQSLSLTLICNSNLWCCFIYKLSCLKFISLCFCDKVLLRITYLH